MAEPRHLVYAALSPSRTRARPHATSASRSAMEGPASTSAGLQFSWPSPSKLRTTTRPPKITHSGDDGASPVCYQADGMSAVDNRAGQKQAEI